MHKQEKRCKAMKLLTSIPAAARILGHDTKKEPQVHIFVTSLHHQNDNA